MCTVIYIPTRNGILMASVRDENPNRPKADVPKKHMAEANDFWAPIDGEAGGTWWSINELGHTVILLNGAFENHLPNTRSYRKSRGLIVKEMADKQDLISEWEQLDLTDIEPFTLVVQQNSRLYECRWDGVQKHLREKDRMEAQIWSSATLYTRIAQQNRRQLFHSFIATHPQTRQEIVDFLMNHREKENGFIMNRSEIMSSLSISVFHFRSSEVEVYYEDLYSNQTSLQTISLS